MRRIKKKDYEKLSGENVRKVISLLEPEEGKPITKKEACNILNISYNTTRLSAIISDYLEQEEYTTKRKKQNRGKPATNVEIAEAAMDYLAGHPIADIAKRLYRSPAFVKELLLTIGVPHRPVSAEDRLGIDFIPEECQSESFNDGELVWSAIHHATAIVGPELSMDYQAKKAGLKAVDYEHRYSSKVYGIYVVEKIDSEDSDFSNTATGGFYAFAPAYDLGKLEHLEKYGVNLDRI